MASFFCGCVVLPLQYLHQMSVAYRDLKPENLLLGQDGYLKVCDAGGWMYLFVSRASYSGVKFIPMCFVVDSYGMFCVYLCCQLRTL